MVRLLPLGAYPSGPYLGNPGIREYHRGRTDAGDGAQRNSQLFKALDQTAVGFGLKIVAVDAWQEWRVMVHSVGLGMTRKQ